MKGLAFTILLFLGCLPGSNRNLLAHGGHMAIFKYQIETGSILLEFQIETEVLQHFDLKEKCEVYDTATAWCLGEYLNSKNILSIRGVEINFELESSRLDEEFHIIKMRAKGDFSNFENIKLSNKCFLEFDKNFENRVIIQKSQEIKSYLLNQNSTELFID